MHLSITECKKLPIRIRKWYVNKVISQLNKEASSLNGAKPNKNNGANPAKEIDINKVNKFFSKFEK